MVQAVKIGVVLLAVSAGSGFGQERPAAVHSRAAAFDVARSRLVLFGGYQQGQYLDETWEFDGAGWSRVGAGAASPPARNSGLLAYDGTQGRVLLFGGDTRAELFGDTWSWDGTEWRLLAASGPPPRNLHAVAWDSRRGRLVLFGGLTADSSGARRVMLGDTWEFDGTRWERLDAAGPSARVMHALAYDSARGRTVLYGGAVLNAEGRPETVLGDTWEWDGARWSPVAVEGPPARDHNALTWDAARRVVVLHGGASAQTGARDDTWEFDGRRWAPGAAGGPRRAGHRLAYDAAQRRVLLYGGWSPEGTSGELWSYDSGGWRRIDPPDAGQ